MHGVVGGILLLVGIVALAVLAQALRSGRVWRARRGLLGRASGWVCRSREPVLYWLRITTLAVSGCLGVGAGVDVLVYQPPLGRRR